MPNHDDQKVLQEESRGSKLFEKVDEDMPNSGNKKIQSSVYGKRQTSKVTTWPCLYPSSTACCFQFLSKIELFCVTIKGQNYFVQFLSMHFFPQENTNANLTFSFGVNAILNMLAVSSSHAVITMLTPLSGCYT